MPQKIPFVKMQGAGNDYIYIDCFKNKIDDPAALARVMSPRRHSVGADGVILICPSDKADVKMRMFNLDGSEGKMCGNGIRCVGKYACENGLAEPPEITVETLSGIKRLTVHPENGTVRTVSVEMGVADFCTEHIPVIYTEKQMINAPLTAGEKQYRITAVSMGNPHAVIFCDEVAALDLEAIGPLFEHHASFPEGVNTEFIRVISEAELEMRVYERGSGETLACGTGACAAVAAAVKNRLCRPDSEVTVHLLGGDLFITCRTDGSLLMRGGAEKVYEGVFSYEP